MIQTLINYLCKSLHAILYWATRILVYVILEFVIL